MTRIVIADDHAIVRKGLRQIISDVTDLTVAGEAGSAEELLSLLRARSFDILVLDLSLGSHDGIDVLKQVRSEFPRLPVLILSIHAEELFGIRSFRAGASGYLQKDSAPSEVIDAIRKVALGGMYVTGTMAEAIAVEFSGSAKHALPHERLSDREFEVFRLLGSGKSVGQIARLLKLSVKTVSTHRTRILEKTGLRNNLEIVRYVILSGLDSGSRTRQ
jgi:DNA-binding NarL/FixJ family response regulator